MTTAADFERERSYLTGLAYRLLGTVADAEDAVQSAYVRWHSAGKPELDHPRAWFTTTCTRICLDRLRSREARRESYVGEWLPEPFVTPEEKTEVDETLSMALLHTIRRLKPSERAAFLLHDVFGYPFDEVANIIGLSSSNCRQLAVRARKLLQGISPRASADRASIEELSSAFFRAISEGDLSSLEKVLAEDVVLTSDGGGKAPAARRPILGRTSVSKFFLSVLRANPASNYSTRSCWFSGAPGVVVYEGDSPVSAFQFVIREGQISQILVQRNPDKLGAFAKTS